jgi:hypothetical protein
MSNINKAKQKQKLIEDYKNAISKYSSENEELEEKIKDLKISLNLNQEILYDFIIKSSDSSDEIKNLVNNTKKLWEENQSLIEKKNFVEIKISRLQELAEDTPTQIREELKNLKIKNSLMQEEIIEKNNLIQKHQKELEKVRGNCLFKNARKEVYITEPSKLNVEIVQELIDLRVILVKLTLLCDKKFDECEKLKKNMDNLRRTLNELIQSALEIQDKICQRKNSIMNIEYNQKDLNNLFDNIEGYDKNIDKSEEEDEDDEDDIYDNIDFRDFDNDDGSEEEESKKNKKELEKKKKELELLTKQYNDLKDEAKQYENKINKHKKVYRELKAKLINLKNSASYI